MMATRTLQQYESALEERKIAAGYVGCDFVCANSGVNRTPEKRALLSELEKIWAERGAPKPFQANY